MESKPHYDSDSGKFIGRTNFRPTLLGDAVAIAVSQVDGVDRLRSDWIFWLKHMFRRGSARGVVIRNVGSDSSVIELCVQAIYGHTAADLSYRIQEAALSTANAMTDKKIKRVCVRIIGASIKKVQNPVQLTIEAA